MKINKYKLINHIVLNFLKNSHLINLDIKLKSVYIYYYYQIGYILSTPLWYHISNH